REAEREQPVRRADHHAIDGVLDEVDHRPPPWFVAFDAFSAANRFPPRIKSGAGFRRKTLWSAGGTAGAEVSALDDLVLGQLAGRSPEGDAPLLHQEELMRHRERHVGVLLDQEDGGAIAIEL